MLLLFSFSLLTEAPPAAARLGGGRRARSLPPVAALLVIGALAYLLNVLTVPLFVGVVQLLFGSVAVLVALRLFGIFPAMLIAFVASLHTYTLWHYPYSIPIFTLEPLFVGLLLRRTRNLVLADAVFWLLVGMPMSWTLYHFTLGFSVDAASLISLKNGVNGLLNALIASFLLLILPLRRLRGTPREAPSFALLLFNLLVGAAVLPALALTLRHSAAELSAADADAQNAVRQNADEMAATLDTWTQSRRRALSILAATAADSPAQLQREAVLLRQLCPEFAGFALVGEGAAPRVVLASNGANERGLARPQDVQRAASALNGAAFSAQPFAARDAGGKPLHAFVWSAPVAGGTTRIVGLLRLEGLQTLLDRRAHENGMNTVVLEATSNASAPNAGRVLASSSPETLLPLRDFTLLDPRRGEVRALQGGDFRWWPTGKPLTLAWRDSVFFARRDSPGAPWRVLVMAPFRGAQERLVRGFIANFLLILGLAGGAMLLARELSRRLSAPLRALARPSTDLPRQLREHDASPLPYPRAAVEEISHLVRNVRHMEGALKDNFNALEGARIEAETMLSIAQNARREAEQANRLKDEFLAVLSHELRTPLVPILGYADLLQSEHARGQALSPDMVNEAARVIERNARAQGALIEDLLDVSRIIAGKMTLRSGSIDLRELLSEVIDGASFNAHNRSVAIRFEEGEAVPRFVGDALRLRQIFANLVNNAVKFSPQGGLVSVRLERDEDRARVEISDTGQGIAPEFLPFVFDRFRQANHDHMTRTAGGLGLGLAIVKHLVELHGGSVSAHSEGEGRGAVFSVELPLSARETPAEVPLPAPFMPHISSAPGDAFGPVLEAADTP